METSKQKEYTFLQKLLNKANMGWWEADLKTESYVCSEFISRLLGIDEDGVISFEDFNKRILREDQHHSTCSILPTGKYGFAVKYAFRKLMGKETPKYTE